MKILMLTDRLESGGAETHVECLCAQLTRRGHRVAVLSGGGRIADRMERAGIAQYRYSWSDNALICHLRAERVLINAQKQVFFDVLHAHTRKTAFLLRNMQIKRSRSCGRPFSVVTVHAAFSHTPLLKKMSYWGDRTIAVSEDLRARVCDLFGVPAEAVSVIPNGVDEEVFYPPAELPRPNTVLFASRLDEDCSLGAELLCKIAPEIKKSHPDLQIRMAGGGQRLDYFRALAQSIDLQCGAHTVTVLGNVDDMASEYRRNAVFVGVSRAAVEASMCGCAVILCGNQGWGGILTPENPMPAVSNFCCRGERLRGAAHLSGALRYLLNDAARRIEIANAARSWMLKDYTAVHMAEAVERVYWKGVGDGKTV